jgi:hypothetical protein
MSKPRMILAAFILGSSFAIQALAVPAEGPHDHWGDTQMNIEQNSGAEASKMPLPPPYDSSQMTEYPTRKLDSLHDIRDRSGRAH